MDEFYEDLRKEDVLGRVIRAHIHIEDRVNALISTLLPFPDKLPRLSYYHKLGLLAALGLDETHIPVYKKLGDIRNSFGHNLKRALLEEEVYGLYSKMNQAMRDIVHSAYENTHQKQGNLKYPSFEMLSIDDQFILIVIAMRGYLNSKIKKIG